MYDLSEEISTVFDVVRVVIYESIQCIDLARRQL